MLADLVNTYEWMLQPLKYESVEQLVAAVKRGVVERAERCLGELRKKKGGRLGVLKAGDHT